MPPSKSTTVLPPSNFDQRLKAAAKSVVTFIDAADGFSHDAEHDAGMEMKENLTALLSDPLVLASPALLLLAQRLSVALPGDLPTLVSEAKAVLLRFKSVT